MLMVTAVLRSWPIKFGGENLAGSIFITQGLNFVCEIFLLFVLFLNVYQSILRQFKLKKEMINEVVNYHHGWYLLFVFTNVVGYFFPTKIYSIKCDVLIHRNHRCIVFYMFLYQLYFPLFLGQFLFSPFPSVCLSRLNFKFSFSVNLGSFSSLDV